MTGCPSRSSARRSTSARRGAASTWGRRRSAMPGLEERLTAIGLRVADRGNVVAPEPEALALHDERARYLPEILDAVRARSRRSSRHAVREGSRPLVLGGDHRSRSGTLAGLAAAAGQPGGVIWIDAHGDLNTPETSPSGNVHGMPLAAALGRSPRLVRPRPARRCPRSIRRASPSSAIRSLDPAERAFLREADIRVFTMSDIDRIGIERAMQRGARPRRRPGLRPRLARPRLARSRGRAGRRHARCAAGSPTARRTSPAS